jgi:hypothetical protein
MKHAVIVIALVSLAGCPGESVDPNVLYYAPDLVETRVKLIDTGEPPPF